jgi:DNA-directed RNA polymerase subunit K/omega
MKTRKYIMALESISIRKMEKQTQDFYEAVVVMSKRAKQVLNNRIAEKMMVSNEEVEMGVYDQIFDKNPEDYEEIEKATTVAVKEFINGELVWKNSEEEA